MAGTGDCEEEQERQKGVRPGRGRSAGPEAGQPGSPWGHNLEALLCGLRELAEPLWAACIQRKFTTGQVLGMW